MSYRSLISAQRLADKLVSLKYIDYPPPQELRGPVSRLDDEEAKRRETSLGGAVPLRVCDATVASSDPASFFRDNHIPSAVFFDLNECADRRSGLTRTVPSAALFEDYVNSLGIGGSRARCARCVCV